MGASSEEDSAVNDDILLPSEKCHLYHLLSYSKEKEVEHGVVALDFNEVRLRDKTKNEDSLENGKLRTHNGKDRFKLKNPHLVLFAGHCRSP